MLFLGWCFTIECGSSRGPGPTIVHMKLRKQLIKPPQVAINPWGKQ